LIKTSEFGLPNRDSDSPGAAIDPAALEEWIRKAKSGDVGSYQEIYEVFARKVLNFIYRMVNSREEAEDLTQETFVAVYQKLRTLKDNSRFEPWLFRIARNFVYQRYRTRAPSMVSVDALDEDGRPEAQVADARKNPDEAFQSGELEDVVADAIAHLPDKYREVFVLSALQGLSYQQIADIVGHSLPSVKTDIHRARLAVRQRVKDYLKV
jgi:RNA polymerase sigma-70 factor (ECF subfamily)